MNRLVFLILALLLVAFTAPSRIIAAPAVNEDPLIDSPMYRDPDSSPIPTLTVF
jgi:hypothetical protein